MYHRSGERAARSSWLSYYIQSRCRARTPARGTGILRTSPRAEINLRSTLPARRARARRTTSPHRARSPSAAAVAAMAVAATTAMLAKNGKSPRRATIIPPSRAHSSTIVTLSPLRSAALGSTRSSSPSAIAPPS